jgi:phage protein D
LYDPNSGFDPFKGSATNANKLLAYCKVVVDGVDVTDRLEPHLELVRVVDSIYSEAYLEVDDRDARLPIPPFGAPVKIEMGWRFKGKQSTVMVFDGLVQDLEHGNDRTTGRKMWVHCWGRDLLSRIKEPMQDHLGEGAPPGKEIGEQHKLGDWIRQIEKNAGAKVKIHPALYGKTRDYWVQPGESFEHTMQDLANQVGAVFRLTAGNEGIFTLPGEEPDGSSTADSAVTAKWGDNLISWRVHPLAARPSWAKTNQQYYSARKGQWRVVQKDLNLPLPWGGAKAIYALPAPAPNAPVSDQLNQGTIQFAGIEPGFGRLCMNGEPDARFNGYVKLTGVRPGVDGIYWITSAEHIYSRMGYVTWLDVQIDLRNWKGGGGVQDGYIPDSAAESTG